LLQEDQQAPMVDMFPVLMMGLPVHHAHPRCQLNVGCAPRHASMPTRRTAGVSPKRRRTQRIRSAPQT
jgi:hypothetical protein